VSLERGQDFVLGADFGTDSVRVVVVDAADGEMIGSGVSVYRRWAAGAWCDAAASRFRQHPLDYVEALEEATRTALVEAASPSDRPSGSRAGEGPASKVRGISIDTTGSTPCLADASGLPLALRAEFAEEPDAMFVLWKDHSSVAEAELVNTLSKSWGGEDYTKYEGGVYSSEWFWAKVLRIVRTNPRVAAAARTIVEHCDWMPALLCGAADPSRWRRSRCAAGHKALWHPSWGGYPPPAFLELLHPRLAELASSLGSETWTAAERFGGLCPEWASRLGLPEGIPVGVGAFDAHVGAIGGDLGPGTLLKIMGTSTCDIMVGPRQPGGEEKLVRGICGQVDGSVLPGMIGYEAGQSAFGDIFAWFRSVLAWPLHNLSGIEAADAARMEGDLLPALEAAAARVDPEKTGLVALDWMNGRRTPDADQSLKGAIAGINLATGAPAIYRSLIEAAAFGSRAIVDRMREEGLKVERVAAVGGVARKSPLVMQITADVLGMEVAVSSSEQSCALGAAMFAATVAGLHPDVLSAQAAMRAPVERIWKPEPSRQALYDGIYRRYLALGAFAERAAREEA
jgi:L-ribulokinase